MVHFNQSGEVCARVLEAASLKNLNFWRVFCEVGVWRRWQFVYTALTFTGSFGEPESNRLQGVFFFPSTLCVCCFVRQHYSSCRGENIPEFGWFSSSLPSFLPGSAWASVSCWKGEPFKRYSNNILNMQIQSSRKRKKLFLFQVVNLRQKGWKRDFKWC